MRRIRPSILGSGGAGQALRQALSLYPDDVEEPRFLPRGESLPPVTGDLDLIVLANPHALHTPRLVEADALGYRWAIVEKPAAVDREQLASLESLDVRTWVCHGYRMLWGPEELRRAVADGRFGELISVEGRYWQSSAARGDRPAGWKDDPALGGRFDVLLDLGTHWVDLVTFLLAAHPDSTTVRRWYLNAASSHRDTHVHIRQTFGCVEAFASVSKTLHGAGNHFEVVLVGSEASAKWQFASPDVIVWGEGGAERTQVRRDADPPARLAPFHGLGWLEGYARVVGEAVAEMRGRRSAHAPTLEEHSVVLGTLLDAAAAEEASLRQPEP